MLVGLTTDLTQHDAREVAQRVTRLRLDDREDVGLQLLDDARGVLRRDLVDGLQLGLNPTQPIAAATRDDLDRVVAVATHELAVVLAQHHKPRALIAVIQPQLGQQLQNPRPIRILVGRLAQQHVDLRLLDQRLRRGVAVGAGRQRRRALKEVLDVVGRDLHPHHRLSVAFNAPSRGHDRDPPRL